MANIIKVKCGTHIPNEIEIDLDLYGKKIPVTATEEEAAEALELFKDTLDDITFAADHHRNEDAVNGCIALHVLGYDAIAWFDNFCEEQKKDWDQWYIADLNKFLEHVDRVGAYLDSWGPEGREADALLYALH